MDFITLDDVTDEILQVSDSDIVTANDYVNGLVVKFRIKPEQLVNPPTYTIRRITVCYACYIRAVNHIGSDAMASYDGGSGDGKDIYAQKAKFYRQELDGLVNNLTTLDFTGEEVSGSITVNVFRA